jgi:hypothetical protein
MLSSTVTNPSQPNLQLTRKRFAELSASSCNAIRLFDPSTTGKDRGQYSRVRNGAGCVPQSCPPVRLTLRTKDRVSTHHPTIGSVRDAGTKLPKCRPMRRCPPSLTTRISCSSRLRSVMSMPPLAFVSKAIGGNPLIFMPHAHVSSRSPASPLARNR